MANLLTGALSGAKKMLGFGSSQASAASPAENRAGAAAISPAPAAHISDLKQSVASARVQLFFYDKKTTAFVPRDTAILQLTRLAPFKCKSLVVFPNRTAAELWAVGHVALQMSWISSLAANMSCSTRLPKISRYNIER